MNKSSVWVFLSELMPSYFKTLISLSNFITIFFTKLIFRPLEFDHQTLMIKELNTLLGKFVGLSLEDEEEKGMIINVDEVEGLFVEEEPSFDELKEAFNVFDHNKDGYIDALDLHWVLCNLGIKEGEDFENCVKMVNGFDRDGDGVMDFIEFLHFMEICLC